MRYKTTKDGEIEWLDEDTGVTDLLEELRKANAATHDALKAADGATERLSKTLSVMPPRRVRRRLSSQQIPAVVPPPPPKKQGDKKGD